MTRSKFFTSLVGALVLPATALAHELVISAKTDCDVLMVAVTYPSGRAVKQGDVRVSDGDNLLQATGTLSSDGTAQFELDTFDHSGGVLVVVQSGHHDDYWILTPEDIAQSSKS
ncbi:MAG: hypothetical protein MK098_04710 [Marinovum sp.]|nr:hypothetical protein [Marinovum sp.]